MNDIRGSIVGKSGEVFEVIAFGADDVDAIHAIDCRASQFPWTKQDYLSSVLSTHLCIGVTHKGCWCAHGVFSIVADQAELLILAVDPECQRNKLASGLLNYFEATFSSRIASILLEVRRSNTAAITLYESLGFNQVGERKNYYPAEKGREDALIFAKEIFSDV